MANTRLAAAGVDDLGNVSTIVIAVANGVTVRIGVALDPVQVVEGALNRLGSFGQGFEVSVVVVECVIDRFRGGTISVGYGLKPAVRRVVGISRIVA